MNENQNKTSSEKGLITLYQTNRDNQELYINQQWKTAYYAVLLYAGIFGVFLSLKNFKVHMYVFAGLTCIISTVIICLCELALSETRRVDKKIREEKSFEFVKIVNKIIGKHDHCKSFSIFILIFVANIISCVFVILSIGFFK